MMVVFKFGWAKPVPINMRNFKNPKHGMAISAAAGPISNLLIAVAVLFLYGLLFIPLGKIGDIGDYISQMLYLTAYLSIALAIFNIIPIPRWTEARSCMPFFPTRLIGSSCAMNDTE